MNTIILKTQKNIFFNTQTFEKKTQRFLSVLLFVLACIYAWALLSTVFATAERKVISTENSKIESNIARIQSEHVALSTQLNNTVANQMGFYKPKEILYATRSDMNTVAYQR